MFANENWTQNQNTKNTTEYKCSVLCTLSTQAVLATKISHLGWPWTADTYCIAEKDGGTEFAGRPESGGPKKNTDWKSRIGKWWTRSRENWQITTLFESMQRVVETSWRWVEFSCRHQTQEQLGFWAQAFTFKLTVLFYFYSYMFCSYSNTQFAIIFMLVPFVC